MSRQRRGLQKDVSAIFSDVALQDVVYQDLGQESEPAKESPRRDRRSAPQTSTNAPDQGLDSHDILSPPYIEPVEPTPPEPADPVDDSKSLDDLGRDEKIQQLKATLPCAKDFTCLRSKLGKLCKARLGKNGKVVQCLEGKKHKCSFRLSFLFRKICRCPIRQYIAKRWGQ